MMNRPLVTVLISALLMFSACEDQQNVDPKQFENAKKFELDNLIEAELIRDENFSIGSYGTVNDMGAVTADDEGNIFVVNEYNKKIEVFNKTGDQIESLGGVGSDPGDYRDPTFLKVKNGHLYAFDKSLFRAYKYELNGLELQSMAELENAAKQSGIDSLEAAQPVKMEVTDDGIYLVGFQVVISTEDRRLIYLKVNESGKVISDKMLSINNRNLYVDRAVDPPLIMMLPYEPEVLVKTDSRGRIYKVDTNHFLINILDSTGAEIESRHYPIEKENLIRSEVVDLYTDTFRRRAIRRASMPDKWPALSHILMDDQDRLWAASIGSDPEIFKWFIIGATGEPLATFNLSRDLSIEAVKGDKIYIKRFNSDEYSDQVLRYTLKF